jgi:DNA-binding winged helix-turn-helix (wHTH) protein
LWQESKKGAARSHGKISGLVWDFLGMAEQEKKQGESRLCFGSHQLDLLSGQLWHGKQEVRMPGKAFAVLRYFVAHPGQLVSKDDLFAAVWPDTVVSDATLASCIQDLRLALGDKAKKPRYIETVHGRGYRFVAAITVQPISRSQHSVASSQEEGRQKIVPSFTEEENGNGSLATSAQRLEVGSLDEALRLDSGQAPQNPVTEEENPS